MAKLIIINSPNFISNGLALFSTGTIGSYCNLIEKMKLYEICWKTCSFVNQLKTAFMNDFLHFLDKKFPFHFVKDFSFSYTSGCLLFVYSPEKKHFTSELWSVYLTSTNRDLQKTRQKLLYWNVGWKWMCAYTTQNSPKYGTTLSQMKLFHVQYSTTKRFRVSHIKRE